MFSFLFYLKWSIFYIIVLEVFLQKHSSRTSELRIFLI